MHFITGLLLYDSNSYNMSYTALIELVEKYSPEELNDLAYKATYIGTGEWRNNAFDFCHNHNLNMNCTILSIETYRQFQEINQNYYSLFNGSCHDSITIPKEAW